MLTLADKLVCFIHTPEDIDMSDNEAVMMGFTREMRAEAKPGMYAGSEELFLLVKPNTDLNSTFKAWNTDDQEWVIVDGWLFSFEDLED